LARKHVAWFPSDEAKMRLLTRGDTIMKVGDALLILTDENSVSEVKKKIGYLANGPLT
jgi:hypothetical protein